MKKIVIFGSTGSIGKSLLKIIKKDKKSFKITLLTARKNYKELLRQAKIFSVKNVILTDKKTFNLQKGKFKKNKIKIFNNYNKLDSLIAKKVDYVMSSIVGIDGLIPTLKIIKLTKNIAIANKESIICAWDLINKELKKYKTNFIPVDSEHFSIWYSLNESLNSKNVKKIYLTASGGPLLNISLKKTNNIRIKKVLKHPNWKMGKKISVDSSNLINKVFEVIEAKKIFGVNYNQLDILVHPDSYIHAIVVFKNDMISLVAHDTTMDIPIFNTLYKKGDMINKKKISNINIQKLNNLSLRKVDKKRFPLVKILEKMPEKNSLFETALVSANDVLVNLFLKKKIKYNEIGPKLLRILNF